jgi:hypothetical protein
MVIERSLGDYYELIMSLTISELIIYYLIVYIFIISLQRILKTEIDTHGKFRTNPKILLGLILLYSYGKVLNFFPGDNLPIEVIQAGTIFIVIIYVLEKTFYGLESKSGLGIVPQILTYFMNKMTESYVKKEKDRHLKGRTVIIKVCDMKKASTRCIRSSNEYKEYIDLFLIDLFVLIIVIHYIVSIAPSGLILILLVPIVLAEPWRDLIYKYSGIVSRPRFETINNK